mgnify:CR=1 FL=1
MRRRMTMAIVLAKLIATFCILAVAAIAGYGLTLLSIVWSREFP